MKQSLTTDRNHPSLGRGVDTEKVPQNEVYLVLSEEERKKGFIRPVRQSYIHVGIRPKYPLRKLTKEENERYSKYKYVFFEKYPENESSVTGRYWTEEQLKHTGCQGLTKMSLAIAETYARNPKFYGATYCIHCQKHLPVEEFVWDGTDNLVGS